MPGKLKKPNLDGTLEGKFKVPLDKMIEVLRTLLAAEMESWYAYEYFGQVLKSPFRDAVVSHFKEHSNQELEHAQKLSLHIVALGGDTNVGIPEPPVVHDLDTMVKHLIALEQEAIRNYRNALKLCGDNEGLRQTIETIIEDEQEHSNDLWLFVPRPEPGKTAEVVANVIEAMSNTKIEGVPTRNTVVYLNNYAHHLERYLLAQSSPYLVSVIEDDAERVVFLVNKKLNSGRLAKVCTVTKTKEDSKYRCTCPNHEGVGECRHAKFVKEWDESGRQIHPILQEAAFALKRLRDSLKYKGDVKRTPPGKRHISPKISK